MIMLLMQLVMLFAVYVSEFTHYLDGHFLHCVLCIVRRIRRRKGRST